MKKPVFLAVLAALLAVSMPQAPAAAVAEAEEPPRPEEPDPRAPNTYVGPAAAFLIPPGSPSGPPIPGAGVVNRNPVGRFDWQVLAGPYEWKCNMVTGFGDLRMAGQYITSRSCTGRWDATGTQYIVSFGRAPYALTQQFDMGAIIVAIPVS